VDRASLVPGMVVEAFDQDIELLPIAGGEPLGQLGLLPNPLFNSVGMNTSPRRDTSGLIFGRRQAFAAIFRMECPVLPVVDGLRRSKFPATVYMRRCRSVNPARPQAKQIAAPM